MKPGRRGFLTVGALTGIGLTLGDFFRLREGPGRPESTTTSSKPRPRASSTSSCPAASPTRSRSIRSPYAPIEYRGELGPIPTKIDGEVFCETLPQDRPDRRQDHGHPLDDARRGGARARHAQHVHRLSAQPGAAVPEHGQRRLPRVRPAQQPAAVCLRPEHAERVRGHRLPELVVRAVQPGRATRPTAASACRT